MHGASHLGTVVLVRRLAVGRDHQDLQALKKQYTKQSEEVQGGPPLSVRHKHQLESHDEGRDHAAMYMGTPTLRNRDESVDEGVRNPRELGDVE